MIEPKNIFGPDALQKAIGALEIPPGKDGVVVGYWTTSGTWRAGVAWRAGDRWQLDAEVGKDATDQAISGGFRFQYTF